MFTNSLILDIFDYICAQNVQCWARITKSDMEIQRYNLRDCTSPWRGCERIIGVVEV